MVTEQIANLSAGNRRLGSNPSLSAKYWKSRCFRTGFFACWGVDEVPFQSNPGQYKAAASGRQAFPVFKPPFWDRERLIASNPSLSAESVNSGRNSRVFS